MVLMPLEIGGREYQSIRGIATLDDTRRTGWSCRQ